MPENNSNRGSWLVIVNPNAGTKKGQKDWEKIAKRISKENIPHSTIFTTKKGHAIELTREKIKSGYRKFLVVGGDGTLNEVVNGIYSQSAIPPVNCIVGMIPVGTGNDWCRSFNIPFSYKKAVKLIKKEKTRLQDVGKVSFYNSDIHQSRYFVNVTGMGYDAVVAAKTNKDKERGRGGPLVYIKNLFTSLLFYKHTSTELFIDGHPPLKHNLFSVSVGIGKYNGGGMMQLPGAVVDDGIFEVTLIKKLGKFTVVRQVKNLYDGSFIHHPKVETYRGQSIEIRSTPPISIEADGESLGHSPFKFEMIPKGLCVVAGKKNNRPDKK